MSPIPIAGPAVEPVTLAEAKAHLRLETDDEDTLVGSLIAAARHTLELATRRAFLAQTWRIRLDCWPEGRIVGLPLAPALAISAMRVTPPSGAPVTLGGDLYRLVDAADSPELIVAGTAPEPGVASDGIEIDASFGFGPDPADVPAPLRLAIQHLVARWFERRGDADEGAMPADVAALIAPFVRPRLV